MSIQCRLFILVCTCISTLFTYALAEKTKAKKEEALRIIKSDKNNNNLRLPYLDSSHKFGLRLRYTPKDLDDITIPKSDETYEGLKKELPTQLSIEAKSLLQEESPKKGPLTNQPKQLTPLERFISNPNKFVLDKKKQKQIKEKNEEELLAQSEKLQREYDASVKTKERKNIHRVPIFRTWFAQSVAHTMGRHPGRGEAQEQTQIQTTGFFIKDQNKLPKKRIERLKIDEIKPTPIRLGWINPAKEEAPYKIKKQDSRAGKRPETTKKKEKVKTEIEKTKQAPLSSKQKKKELQKTLQESIKEVEDGEVE